MRFFLLKQKSPFGAGDPALIGLDIHQNNVRSDPANTLPGDHKILPSAPQTQDAARAGDDNGNQLPVRQLYTGIAHEAQPPAVADADDLLTKKVCKLTTHTQPPIRSL